MAARPQPSGSSSSGRSSSGRSSGRPSSGRSSSAFSRHSPGVPSSETVAAAGRELARFVPDVVAMLRGVLADPRVPQQAKVEAGAALAYLVSPANRLTSWVPIIGTADDVAVVAFALRRLLSAAGEPVLRDHWRGSARGLDVLLGVTTALVSPRGMLRRTAVLGAVASAVRGVAEKGGPFGSRRGAVIDGEVVDRRPGR